MTCADVGNEVCDALLLKELGKQTGPVRLYGDTGRLYECLNVVSLQERCTELGFKAWLHA